jgi:hypothetical protein
MVTLLATWWTRNMVDAMPWPQKKSSWSNMNKSNMVDPLYTPTTCYPARPPAYAVFFSFRVTHFSTVTTSRAAFTRSSGTIKL